MRPKREPEQPQRELFQIDLEQSIDKSHPLVRLVVRLGLYLDWSSFEQTLGSSRRWVRADAGFEQTLGSSRRWAILTTPAKARLASRRGRWLRCTI
jgi:hypothetical protein